MLCKQKVAADLTGVVFSEDSSHVLAAGRTALKVCYGVLLQLLCRFIAVHTCTFWALSVGLRVLETPTSRVAITTLNFKRCCLFLQSWSLSWSSPRPGRSRSSGGGANGFDAASTALSLTERQVNLKQQRASSFVDLCLAPSGPGQPVGSVGVYALTDKGNLLLLRPTGRSVDRSLNLQVSQSGIWHKSSNRTDAALGRQQVRCSWCVLLNMSCICRCGRRLAWRRPPSWWHVPAHKGL